MQPVNEILASMVPPEKPDTLQVVRECMEEALKIIREIIDHVESASEGGQSDGK